MLKKVIGVVLSLFLLASIVKIGTASDYNKENLISYDDSSKAIEIIVMEKEVNEKTNTKKDKPIKEKDVKNNSKEEKEKVEPKKEIKEDTKNNIQNKKSVNNKSKIDKSNQAPEKNKVDKQIQAKAETQKKSSNKTKDKEKAESKIKKEIKTNTKSKDKPQAKKETQSKPKPKPKPKLEPNPKPNPKPEPSKPKTSSSQYEQEVIRLVNIERQKLGLNNLKASSKLANVARYKSQDMIDNNYFSHDSPTYGSPFNMMKKFGISYSFAGENIAAGQATPKAVVDAWMKSPGHKANILNKNFTQIGIGYIKNSDNYSFWTQMFIG